MKKRILASFAVIGIAIIVFCFCSHTTTFRGVVVEEGVHNEVKIVIKNRNIDWLLNRLTGTITIQTEEDTIFVYNSLGPSFHLEDYFFESIYRWDYIERETERVPIMENGYIYFDRGFRNVAIITSERTVFSADANFMEIILQGESFRAGDATKPSGTIGVNVE